MTTDKQGYGVIWDFDGTLVDSMPIHFVAWRKFMESYNHDFTYAEFIATAGKPAEEILAPYFKGASKEEILHLGDLKDGVYREEAERQHLALAPGAEKLLRELHQAGFKQALGSGTPRKNLELAYRLHPQLREYIQAEVIAGDTKNTKPDPEVFLAAAGKLGLNPSNCLVVEDGLLGIEAAGRAGMPSIGVLTGGQAEAEFWKRGVAMVVPTLQEVKVADIVRILENNHSTDKQAPVK